MKHPTKQAFLEALRMIVARVEAELEIPEDPDAVQHITADGVLPPLASWLLREVYEWGFAAGFAAADKGPQVKPAGAVAKPPLAPVFHFDGEKWEV